MATASKRITRKELRRPDWFQLTTERALEFYRANQIKVWIGTAALAVLLLAIWGWQEFKEQQNSAAAEEYRRAITLFQAQNYREAIPALEKVQAYRWSRYSSLAYLYESNSYLALNNLDKAITTAQRFIATTSSDSLYRQIGLLALATAEERKNNCKQAIAHYAEAERIHIAMREKATLGKARCAQQIGDTKTALSAYRDYLKDHPGSYVQLEIAELEAKSAAQPMAK
jgi:predicted negative regulator of RcsB-dependent stress response